MEAAIQDAQLLSIFETFDTQGGGYIDESDVQQALRILGVKFSMSSARKAFHKMDKNMNGKIEKNEFLEFCKKVSNPEELKSLLSAESQRFIEYKQMCEHVTSFERQFPMPSMLPAKQKLEGHNAGVEKVSWVTDATLVSASADGDLRMWQVSEGAVTPVATTKMELGSPLYSLVIAPDGQRALAGFGKTDENLGMWSFTEKRRLMTYEGHTSTVYSCAFSPDQHTLASGSKSGALCTHDSSHQSPQAMWPGHDGIVQSVNFSRKTPSLLCTASRDGTVKVFDMRTASSGAAVVKIEECAAAGCVYHAVWRQDDILSSGDDYCIKRWDLRRTTEGPIMSYFGHSAAVKTLEMSPDERYFVSGTHTGSMRLWQIDEQAAIDARLDKDQQVVQELTQRRDVQVEQIRAGEATPEDLKATNERLAAAQAEVDVLVEAQNAAKLVRGTQAKLGLEGPNTSVTSISWRDGTSKDSALVACGLEDQSVRIFDVDVRTLAGIGGLPPS